jgi:hypothetical protein
MALVAFVLWFVYLSPTLCPVCGAELGMSLTDPGQPPDRCTSCGWQRR